jgi:hypothetical protein
MKLTKVHLITLALSLTLFFSSLSASATKPNIIYTKIVDTNTTIPLGVGNFSGFSKPALDGSSVAFSAVGSNNQSGIYIATGGILEMVADTNTATPGGTGNFKSFVGRFLDSFGNPSLDGIDVAFLAIDSGNTTGIYKTNNGVLKFIADTNTPVPGGTANNNIEISQPSLDAGSVAFRRFQATKDSLFSGIYISNGETLRVVADSSTAVLGGEGDFTEFNRLELDDGDVVFSTFGTDSPGIYTLIDDNLEVVADTSTLIPDGTGNFVDFSTSHLSIEGGEVLFGGVGFNSEAGIFKAINGTLEVVADNNTAIPDGTGNFDWTSFISSAGTSALDEGNVAFFIGVEEDPKSLEIGGIYMLFNGMLVNVIDENDNLDGKKIDSIVFDSEGLSGNTIAFRACLSDDSCGIYTATLSEISLPAAFWLFSSAIAGMGIMLRRKS